MKLYPHQVQALEQSKGYDNVAYYYDMGLGKTYIGAEQLKRYGKKINLVVCQKSKISDWIEHFNSNYPNYIVLDLTCKRSYECYNEWTKKWGEGTESLVGVINYDLIWRRTELSTLKNFTLMLDESSLIQNDQAKRSKYILKLKPAHVILLSGTPTGGRYENLYSQMKLLGWKINKTTYWNTFIEYHYEDYGGFPLKIIDGYKNVERLKRKMREYGCQFMKSEEVLDLPEQNFIRVGVGASKEYRKFRKDRLVTVDDTQLMGDTTLTKMLYERQLCGQYSKFKLEAFKDLLESTEDRLIVFYNFNEELKELKHIVADYDRPISIVNGNTKQLNVYEYCNNSVTFIQYQAGAMGLNLQKANKIIYFTPPLSSELYEQSKKRIHRIGQNNACYYYNLIVKNSIEEKIYKTLEMRQDYTDKLFEED